jgi:uncharacterized protein YecE (DUF72 family)
MPILVGTASWTDKTLIDCGRFYPPGVNNPEGRLRHYASLFPLVEVDASYYAVPSPATTQLWVERTPPGFVFNVKAFRLFTGHYMEPKVLPKDLQTALGTGKARWYDRDVPAEVRDELWRRFIDALQPLRAAGKLGLVHFQFAPWLVNDAKGRDHLAHCVQRMAGHLVSVEFRHRTWFTEQCCDATLELERKLGVVHTVVDEPQSTDNSIPAVWATTHPAAALVRLHGRNADTWNIKGAASAAQRFVYDYPDRELQELLPRIERLSRTVGATHVIFNNCFEDQGQRNGLSLMRLARSARA